MCACVCACVYAGHMPDEEKYLGRPVSVTLSEEAVRGGIGAGLQHTCTHVDPGPAQGLKGEDEGELRLERREGINIS